MPLSINLVTPPAAEPLSLSLLKTHLRVDSDNSAEDVLLTAWITAARQYVERYTHRAIFEQTWTLNLDSFCCFPWWNGTVQASAPREDWLWRYSVLRGMQILLPKPKLVSVTSITYIDVTNTTRTLDPSAYYVDATSEPARLVPASGQTWPSVQAFIPGSVQITFLAGTYGDGVNTNTCPQSIVLAMELLCAHFYEHREAASELSLKEIPLGVQALLESEVVEMFGYANN